MTPTSPRHGILVTGSHRSGTTWMGRMLSIPDDVVYIQEPFNLETSTDSMPYRFDHWFPYTPGMKDREAVYQALEKTMEFRHVPPMPPHLSAYRALRRKTRIRLENTGHRWKGKRPLLKDPLALFSAEDLAERFNLDVVCMVRHPLGFCSSLKKWDWKFPFSHLLEQPALIKRHFREEANEIAEFAREEQPIVRQAALLWNLFHKVIRTYQKSHPDWHFPRHAEMVADPVPRFEALYKKLGLSFTPSVSERLSDSLHSGKGETSRTVYQSRDAASVSQTWKNRLTEEEIGHIISKTEKLRLHFYPEETDPAKASECLAMWGWSSAVEEAVR